MADEVNAPVTAEDDTWGLAAIQGLCATLERRAIDRFANVHDDRRQSDELLRFLTLAGEVLEDQSKLEAALECLENTGVATAGSSSFGEGSGNGNCPWPWVWDPELQQCVLPG